MLRPNYVLTLTPTKSQLFFALCLSPPLSTVYTILPPFSFVPLDLLINSQCFDSSVLMNGSPVRLPVALELMFILLSPPRSSVRPSLRLPVAPSLVVFTSKL